MRTSTPALFPPTKVRLLGAAFWQQNTASLWFSHFRNLFSTTDWLLIMILISYVNKTFSPYTLPCFPPKEHILFYTIVGFLPRRLQNHSKWTAFVPSFWRNRHVSYLSPTSWLFSDIFPVVGVSICGCQIFGFDGRGAGVRTRAKISFLHWILYNPAPCPITQTTGTLQKNLLP